MRHCFKWDVTPKELRDIADSLEHVSCIMSIEIEKDCELVIRNKLLGK